MAACGREHVSYDLLGNRLSDQAQTSTAPWQYNANNELLSSSLNLYDYNENGSTIAKKQPDQSLEQRYLYNTEARLAEVKDGTDQTIATYTYDPFGRRRWKTVAANQPGNDSATPKTTYLYYTDEGYAAEYTHDGNHPTGDTTITPTLSQLYLFAPQGLWSTEPLAIKQTGTNGGWRYPETDHLGTPHGLLSSDGAETTALRANAFGQTEVTGEALPLRFAGQIEDEETGAYYNYFRDYEPGTGRYVESDPVGLRGGVNSYSYVGSQPLSLTDALGLCAPSKDMKRCLENVFGESIDGVKVRNKRFVRNEWITTRKNSIRLPPGFACDDFWSNPHLVLHEYFHVLRQWNTGKLTRRAYAAEYLDNGAEDGNRFEDEANAFADSNLADFKKCLEGGCDK